MQLLGTKKQKPKANQYVDQNPVEAIRSMGGGSVQSLAKDVIQDGLGTAWKQFFGESAAEKSKQQHHVSGDLAEGQDLDLSQTQEQKKPYIEAGIDYRREILHYGEKKETQYSYALADQIEQIIRELKELAARTQEVAIEFKDVASEQRVVKPGKYHKAFFEWVLIMIQIANTRVESAAACLQALHSKQNKKQQANYWQMFKKHGTTFGLSNERVVATQTG